MSESLKAKLEEAKTFAKQHQVAIACSATAIVTFIVVQKLARPSVTMNLTDSRNELDAKSLLEHLTLREFIDHKELKDEFKMFYQQMND